MTPYETFKRECSAEIDAMGKDAELQRDSLSFMHRVNQHRYSYHFEWMGRPIIQYPQDIVAMQEIIWEVRPDLIIETGIAHGGSLVFSASMLALLDLADAESPAGAPERGRQASRKVLGVDIDIRSHNREAIERHPMASRIEMIQGSSTAASVIEQVKEFARGYSKVLVCLDSNHTHEHVLAELEAYAPLTSVGSYCVVFDTIIEDFPGSSFADRPWGPGNSPKTAVREFLSRHSNFSIEAEIQQKLLLTVAPDGYLKRVS